MRSRSSACACFRWLLCVGLAGSGEDYEGDHKGDASSQDGPPDEVYETHAAAPSSPEYRAADGCANLPDRAHVVKQGSVLPFLPTSPDGA